ncbi:beta-galactosidase [Coraliomargarita algicola]|uniref:beta-galactosidase n=1 Tax=Coraliomargarita algicola TaxID=3092156 RepID=A0ABZ0RHM1_9BACT|nr:beta-galactosidase [Coraliomargarita sp. J2-16]WPJ95552.1 beta-galactosidase [Coraliomargarita sp. J2-16]
MSQSAPKNFFPVGASYAPLAKAREVSIDQWEEDIANMQELGLNVFRLFICWDRVEIQRGQRDFSRIDHAFDLAAKKGVKVLANVGGTFSSLQGIYSPRWLVNECGCTLLTPTQGATPELKANRFYLCYDDPTYQREAKAFIQEAVARYQNHPALLAWSGWNEPRLSECFCEHSIAAFRSFLKDKYHSLEGLMEAWSTEFPLRFDSWDEVYPQAQAGFEHGGYAPYIDWKSFVAGNRTNKFNLVQSWIKEVDATTPVISHIAVPSEADIFGEEDILGVSIYTVHRQGKIGEFTPYYFTFVQNAWRIQEGFQPNRADPDGFWVVETEAGPVSWVHGMQPYTYSPRKMNARDMHYIAFGARSLIRWLYRSRVSDAQAGEFNLVGWDGRVTPRAEEFGRLGQFLNQHADLFLNHHTDHSGVMILDSTDCSTLAAAEGYYGRYWTNVPYLYNAFLHIGVRPQVCNARQIMEGILDGVKVLYIPFRPYVSDAMASVLRSFVEAGGTLIAESPFAIKNMEGVHHEVTPGKMTDVFGAQVYDLGRIQEATCGGIPAADFKAEIDVQTALVEASFENGDPAIVSHRFGRGTAVLYASLLSNAYQLNEPFQAEDLKLPTISYAEGEAFRQELRQRVQAAGIEPAWELSDISDESRINIQVIIRQLPDGRRMIFILNMDDKANTCTLRIPGLNDVEEIGNSETECAVVLESDQIQVRLNEWGWTVLCG